MSLRAALSLRLLSAFFAFGVGMNKLPRGIKKEAKPLLQKSLNSLTLSIELFNRPSDRGRTDTVLILFDHSVEMLLKASIVQKGAKIHDPGMANAIGFQKCVDRACSHPSCRFLSIDEARVFKAINSLRDAAQHYFLDVSEEQLYFHVQSGLTLVRDIMTRVFGIDLITFLPRRVLPLSTVALTTIEVLFNEKIDEIRKMLSPGKRRRQEAIAALRPLIILERSIRGEDDQPSERELRRIADQVRRGEDWSTMFPGVNLVEFTADGSGPTMALRFSKKEGVPFVIVAPGTDGATTVMEKRVDELGYYSLMTKQIAEHLGLSVARFLALAMHLKLQDDAEYFKHFKLGSVQQKRYSPKALALAREAMAQLSGAECEVIWTSYLRRNVRAIGARQ
jgi:hypothetical protein